MDVRVTTFDSVYAFKNVADDTTVVNNIQLWIIKYNHCIYSVL